MPVRAFHQESGRLVDRTREAGLSATSGWWSSVTVADLRGAGARDMVLGNRGLNSYVTASAREPARMYVGDLAHNGTLQQIITFYKHGVSYPVAGRDELLSLNPGLRDRYTSYKSFGAAKVEDIFPAADLRAAQVREASTFASAVALNDGKGVFTLRALPQEAQLAPIYAAVAQDFDGDGRTDLLVGGNLYGAPPVYGRYDASIGLMLKGGGTGAFTAVDPLRSGISIDGQVRDMKVLRGANGTRLIAVARNNAPLLILRVVPNRISASPSPASH
jgi:enediyne biosynthesis protein E4